MTSIYSWQFATDGERDPSFEEACDDDEGLRALEILLVFCGATAAKERVHAVLTVLYTRQRRDVVYVRPKHTKATELRDELVASPSTPRANLGARHICSLARGLP